MGNGHRLTREPRRGGEALSKWQELFERQHSEERMGTADPATNAQERVDLREELEEQQPEAEADDHYDDE